MKRCTPYTAGALALLLGANGLAGCLNTETPMPAQKDNGGDNNKNDGGGAKNPPAAISDMRALCTGGKTVNAGPRMLRRLTGPQIVATLRAAFGLSTTDWPDPTLPPDAAAANGFNNNADRLLVADGLGERMATIGEQLGDLVVQPAHLATLVPCGSTGGKDCAGQYLDKVGRALYRRPLTSAERDRYLALFDTVAKGGGLFTDWVKWATAALVQSPNMLYRSELGTAGDGGKFRLDGYEVASALSYTLTDAPPSAALLDAAAKGTLSDPAQIATAARGLTGVSAAGGALQPAVQAKLQTFMRQWLHVDALGNVQRDPAKYTGFGDAVVKSMAAELDAFATDTLLTHPQGPGLAAFLTSDHTFVDPTLAQFYGFGSAAAGTMTSVAKPPEWGVGVLALGAIQLVNASANSTSPTKRGLLVRRRFLCQNVPPPPGTVQTNVPDSNGADTTRQRYEQMHSSNPGCAACHNMMDPIGYGFEHLDAVGRYREKENGFAIDDSGKINAPPSGMALSFQGEKQLATMLSTMPETHQCFTAFLASYSWGLDDQDTSCMVTDAAQAFQRGDVGLPELLVRLVSSPVFLERQ